MLPFANEPIILYGKSYTPFIQPTGKYPVQLDASGPTKGLAVRASCSH